MTTLTTKQEAFSFSFLGSKLCARCDTVKEPHEFGPNRARKDGLSTYCRTCTKDYTAGKGYDKARWDGNRERESARSRLYRERNAARLRARWRESAKAKREANPALIRKYNIARKHGQQRATPAWADMAAMSAIYAQVKALEAEDGIERHVDHEIPLKHPLVCGLHVHQNLRILTAQENMQKHNKFTIED